MLDGGRRPPAVAEAQLSRDSRLVTARLITELAELDPLEVEWDSLAGASQLPLMSPACVRAWWRHLAPPTAEPRVVALWDAERLVGLAPFYMDLAGRRRRPCLRLPGIELGVRLAPLAAPGRERAVFTALASTIAHSKLCPDLVALEGVPLATDWTVTLREGWPRGARLTSLRNREITCPTVSLQAPSFDAWLSAKSSNFRREMRRLRRQFASAGGTTRTSTPGTLESDIDTFMRLHSSRWEDRGNSNFVALGSRLPAVLNDIGASLLGRAGFRLRLCEVEGEAISAQLFLASGGRVLYINGGWDERFAQFKPSMLGILAVIEEAFERGERHVDLGPGAQHYKLRFADSSDPVASTNLMPASIRTVPMRAKASLRDMVKRRLSEQQIIRLRQCLGRLGAGL